MTTEVLDEINRIHDDEPERAANALRALDALSLPAERLPLFAFLLIHVVGEKLGRWDEAADRLERLRTERPQAPPAVAAHAATAAHLAGRAANPALDALAEAAGETAARVLVELNAMGLRHLPETSAAAAGLLEAARQARQVDAECALKRPLAIALNNATSRLLDLANEPVDEVVRAALLAGSGEAQRFWQAAGTWVNHERALYLRALVHNRIGAPDAARVDCEQALALIDAHGGEDVDRAFLQLQLAGALLRLGEAAAGERHLADARAAAAAWSDAGLRDWFAGEHRRVFGSAEAPQ